MIDMHEKKEHIFHNLEAKEFCEKAYRSALDTYKSRRNVRTTRSILRNNIALIKCYADVHLRDVETTKRAHRTLQDLEAQLLELIRAFGE